MKFTYTITCKCGEIFPLEVNGNEWPDRTQCPKCCAPASIAEPPDNIVGISILGRALMELKNEDWTLTIVLSSMAIECELAYLFMKWKQINLEATTTPTEDDKNTWETQWRNENKITGKFDKVSKLMTAKAFDEFVTNNYLMDAARMIYPESKSGSERKFFEEHIFYKRNRIVHFGKMDFEQDDAKRSVVLAELLFQILHWMDTHGRKALARSDGN